MNKTFKIELNEQEVNTVLAALNELPIKVGLQTLQKIVSQAQEQASASQEVVAVPDSKSAE